MDVGIGIVLAALVLIGTGALLVVRLGAASLRTTSTRRTGEERAALRAAGGRALVPPLTAGALVAAAGTAALLGTGLPGGETLLSASPLLVAAAGLLAFALLPAARRPAATVTTALLEPRRPTAFVPRAWLGLLGGAAALLLVLVVLGVALERPVASDAGFVRWEPSVAGAIVTAFPSTGAALAVGAGLLAVLVAGGVALQRIARRAALTGALASAEPAVRGLPARIVVLVGGGAIAAELGWALCRVGGQAWSWGTIPEDPAAALAALAVPSLALGAVSVLLAVAAWIAAVALAASLLRPGRALVQAAEGAA